MILLHSILAFYHTIPGKILLTGTIIMDSALALVVAGPSGNRQWMIVAVVGNLTALIIAGFTGWVQLKIARTSAANSKMLIPLVGLPDKVTELAKGIDGVAHELKAATAEGNLAKVDAANARGQLKEREAETARQGAAALAQQAAPPPGPAPVIVENPPENPVNVKPN